MYVYMYSYHMYAYVYKHTYSYRCIEMISRHHHYQETKSKAIYIIIQFYDLFILGVTESTDHPSHHWVAYDPYSTSNPYHHL